MQCRAIVLAGLTLLGAPVNAQSVLDDPNAAGALMGAACVTDSVDWDAVFATARNAMAAQGLATMTDTDEVATFGLPTAPNLMATRTIDSLACRLIVPAGDEAYFNALRDAFGTAVSVTYPKALSVASNTPSPHDEKHEWVRSIPGERHFAATLEWQADRGVMLGIGYRQIYE